MVMDGLPVAKKWRGIAFLLGWLGIIGWVIMACNAPKCDGKSWALAMIPTAFGIVFWGLVYGALLASMTT